MSELTKRPLQTLSQGNSAIGHRKGTVAIRQQAFPNSCPITARPASKTVPNDLGADFWIEAAKAVWHWAYAKFLRFNSSWLQVSCKLFSHFLKLCEKPRFSFRIWTPSVLASSDLYFPKLKKVLIFMVKIKKKSFLDQKKVNLLSANCSLQSKCKFSVKSKNHGRKKPQNFPLIQV